MISYLLSYAGKVGKNTTHFSKSGLLFSWPTATSICNYNDLIFFHVNTKDFLCQIPQRPEANHWPRSTHTTDHQSKDELLATNEH